MAWIELHDNLREHRKVYVMCEELNINKAHVIGLLCLLWSWCNVYAQDGVLTGLPHKAIAVACDWSKNPEQLIRALIKSGWIDESPEGQLCVHDWEDYAGRLIDKRASNASRMRDARARRSQEKENARAANVQRTLRERSENVQRTLRERSPHVQGLPNLTEPNLEEEEEERAREVVLDGTEEPLPDVVRCYENFSVLIQPRTAHSDEVLGSFLDDGLTDDMICAVIEEAYENGGRNLKYLRTVLQRCSDDGIRTLEQYKEYLKRWRNKGNNGSSPKLRR